MRNLFRLKACASIVATLALASISPQVQAQSITPTQKVAAVPLRYARTVQFLKLLAQSQGRKQSETFGERKVAFPHVPRLMSFISARGVSVVDVNENNGRPLVVSKTRLRGDLMRTGSSAFDSFAYAGYIFNMNYAQYSQLSCKPTRDGVVVEMPSGHRFTWARERGLLMLRKLEYLGVEGD